ncbi:unnamed protein product, partial [marine sediment metagenome]
EPEEMGLVGLLRTFETGDDAELEMLLDIAADELEYLQNVIGNISALADIALSDEKEEE